MKIGNQFVYLYPIEEYLGFELEKGSRSFEARSKGEDFSKVYFRTLNKALELRYRQKGFGINRVVFDDRQIHLRINVGAEDRTISAGMDFETHIKKRKDRTYPYPDNSFILNQIPFESHLVVSGFHVWDCVDKFARYAYEKGLNVLVDEDLTEFLAGRILGLLGRDFNLTTYPSINPKEIKGIPFELFMRAREGKPRFFQDY